MRSIFEFYILITLIATSFLHAMAIDVTTTWVGDTIKGTTASLQCSWTNGNPTNVVFSPNNDTGSNDFYFNCVVQTNLQHSCTPGTLALSRYSANSSQQGSVSMMISNLQCADDGMSYFCLVGGTFQTPTISKAVLAVKVRPTMPILSNLQTDVEENFNITATCTAVVGYPNAAQIVWKTYGQIVDLSSELIISASNVTQPGDDRCTVRTQSSVSLKANRLYQNISLACFVINQDSTAPESCNPTTDLCVQTSPTVITYPVSRVNVAREPASTLYEGTTVILKCQAEGNPLPTYTWTKVGDENRTISSVMDGLYSTVTLTSLNKTLDAGNYNCTASNVVKNKNYSAFGVISLVIYEATTPAPTTTTATTKKTSTSSGTTSSVGTDSPGASTAGDSDKTNIIIGVVVGVGGALIIALIIIIIVCYRRKKNIPKSIVNEPTEKTFNNNTTYNINLTNASMKSPQPDLVAGEKKMNSSSLNSSFDLKNDGLGYADLTYDNRPRSRKPMAINDNGSIYSSEIQMPEV